MLIAILFSLLTPAAQAAAQAESTVTKSASPEALLNADGTLNLEGSFNGALDLEGYSVEIDPVRGPVFGAQRSAQSAVTPGNWAALGDGGGVVDGYVRSMLVDGTNVYIGGDFTDLANLPAADYVAKWDGANWSALGSTNVGNGSLSNGVSSLAMSGTDLYVGGSFGQVYNGVLVSGAVYIAKWDTLTGNWSALGSNGAGGGSLNGVATKIAVSGSNVYVSGNFTNVNNGGTVIPEADYVAKWDGANWSALGSNGAGDGSFIGGSYISSLAVSGTDVYVGGSFTDVNNSGTVLTAADRVAKWDGSNWSALGSNGAANGSITSGTVYSLGVNGSNVYVGGQFTDVNNNGSVLTTADYLAKWDGTNWAALGSNGAGNGALNDIPWAFFFSGTDVYVGGEFMDVNNSGTPIPEADYLAKWDGNNWSAIGSNGAGDGAITSKGGSFIFAFAMQGSNLLAGGMFFDLNNGGTVLPQADYLAKWDGVNWSSLGTAANGALVGGYANNQVYAIAVIGTDLYVGGRFTNISNHGVNIPAGDYIAKWDGANWSALGSNGAGDGAFFNSVFALAVIGTDLYVGGQFSNVNNNGISLPAADYIAKWDTLTNTWSALGSNGAGNGSLSASGFVNTLAVSGTDLYMGGQFTNVNNGGTSIPEADYLAKWNTLTGNWSALGSNGVGDGALNAQVATLAFGSLGELYVGGIFTNAATIPEADYLAKWNAGSWSALGSNGAGDGALNNGVLALGINGLNVYAGGFFSNVNNNGTVLNSADYIAKWDGANWSALGSNSALNGTVRAIALSGSDIYVGGSFADVNNIILLTAADHIAKWDGTNWSALGSNGVGNGSISGNNDIVYTLFVNGEDLLVGGQFSNVNNNGTVIKEADYIAAYGMASDGPDLTPPTVVSVTRLDPSPTSAATIRFLVTFSESVGGLDSSNFPVTAVGITGAAVTNMNCPNATCTITVGTGAGNGTIRLDVSDDDTIIDGVGNPLGGVGLGNGDFITGEVYTVNDVISPSVLFITRFDINPTSLISVSFAVAFSEPVTGVTAADFSLTTTGVSSATISTVNGTGRDYVVTVNTGSGNGTIRLNVVDDNSIVDAALNPLGGAAVGDGNFITGEVYTIDKSGGGDSTGVFRPSNGLLYLKHANTTGFADVAINYGTGGDYPIAGDWDGNGTATIGIYRNGSFYLRNSNTLGFADIVFAFGTPGDQPVAGDWDGDGVDTIGVYSNGQFLLRNSNSAGVANMSFYLGNPGDVGIAGDWNGDGSDTTGVFRPSNGIIFLKNANTTGFADVALNYGLSGDMPVTGDWNNDGIDTIGVYRNAQFLLRNSNTIGFAEIVFGLGNPGDMPISGNWDGIP